MPSVGQPPTDCSRRDCVRDDLRVRYLQEQTLAKKERFVPLPPLTDVGELPPGVHRASLREVRDRFGTGSRQRMAVADRFDRIHRLAHGTGHLARFVVFGSFITDKAEPNDVDVFLIMDDAFSSEELRGETALLFDHAAADSHFGASVFWVRRLAALGGEQSAIEFWQVKRGGGQRGIVEIIEETP
jgi:hypothetical protein